MAGKFPTKRLSSSRLTTPLGAPGRSGRRLFHRLGMAAGLIFLRRQVQARVGVEESRRHQLETAGDAGLYREILRPGLVVQAESVPGDHVRVFERPALLNIGRNAVTAIRVVHEVSSREPFLRFVGGEPKVVVDEGRTLA